MAGPSALGSIISPSFGSSPVCLLHLWIVGLELCMASRAGGQAGDTTPQPGTHSGLHTELPGLSPPHCPGCDLLRHPEHHLEPAGSGPALLTHLPLRVPHHRVSVQTLLLCAHNYTLSFSLYAAFDKSFRVCLLSSAFTAKESWQPILSYLTCLSSDD